jgi:hypothetical protein
MSTGGGHIFGAMKPPSGAVKAPLGFIGAEGTLSLDMWKPNYVKDMHIYFSLIYFSVFNHMIYVFLCIYFLAFNIYRDSLSCPCRWVSVSSTRGPGMDRFETCLARGRGTIAP